MLLKIYENSIRFKKYKIDVLFKYHNCEKNAKNKYDLEFNVTFSPIMSLNVTRLNLINKGFVTK